MGDKFKFTKTGGIYVVVEGKGFSILLNGKVQDAASIFRRNLFIQNLHPDLYSLKVTKDGFYPWEKRIVIVSEKVADVYPFNLPEKVDLVEIPKTILEDVDKKDTSTSSIATTSKQEVDNDEYAFAKDIFATSSSRLVVQKLNASNTKALPKQFILYKKIALWSERGEIFVQWQGDNDSAPLYFCAEDTCLNKLSVFKGAKINNADFITDKQTFVIFTTDSGIYVTEIDDRGGRNIQALVLGTGYDFRIGKDGTLFIKKEKKYYKVDISL